MSNAVSINPNSSAVNRYSQYLSDAQSSLNDAITRANSILSTLPNIYSSITSITLVKSKLSQLISTTTGTINLLSQRDIENAKGILGYDSGNISYTSELSSLSRTASTLVAVSFAPSLSDDLISAIVHNQRGNLPIAQAKGFVFEWLLARKINLFSIFSSAKVVSNNKTGQDILLQGFGKSKFIEAKAGKPSYASKINKLYLKGKYPNGVVATKELAKKLDDIGVKSVDSVKKISSSIKLEETEGVAALSRGSSSVGKFVTKSILQNAGKAGVLGAVFGGGIEAAFGWNDYKNGTISGKQYANNIARESVAGFASAAVTTVAIGALSVTALPGVAVAAVGIAAGVAIGAGVSWLWKKLRVN